jgi:sortase A
MRLKQLVLLVAAVMVVAALAACGSGDDASSESGQQGGQTTREEPQTTPDQQVAPDQGDDQNEEEAAEGPEDKTLRLTVPGMARVENAVVPTGPGNQEALFRDYTAVHLKGTGFPWEDEANVYIAGHALGYPGTDSYLAFYDLGELQNGEEVLLEDANGTRYTYEVFNTLVVEPTNLSVLDPIEGKNIVSLQSCTLPDYSDRIIVQAELKDTQEA